MFPGTFVKADQCRLLWVDSTRESTRAKQINFPFFWTVEMPYDTHRQRLQVEDS